MKAVRLVTVRKLMQLINKSLFFYHVKLFELKIFKIVGISCKNINIKEKNDINIFN